jgi:hypothetical protein
MCSMLNFFLLILVNCNNTRINCSCIELLVCSGSFIVCVVSCGVLFCVKCLIVVPLPPGENPFAVKINTSSRKPRLRP